MIASVSSLLIISIAWVLVYFKIHTQACNLTGEVTVLEVRADVHKIVSIHIVLLRGQMRLVLDITRVCSQTSQHYLTE